MCAAIVTLPFAHLLIIIIYLFFENNRQTDIDVRSHRYNVLIV